MKKIFKFMTLATATVAAIVFTGCSSDDEFLTSNGGEKAPQTRAGLNPDGSYTITFDDFPNSMMAGPTSYGANYYGGIGSYSQVTSISDKVFTSTVNTISGSTAFWNGGIALSKWNYRSNPATPTGITVPRDTVPADWWYSYNNQMSVYNTASTDGTNVNAGHSGSNFGVVYGYKDSYNSKWMDKPTFSLNKISNLVGLWICNSAYTYGVIMNGNTFGNTGSATILANQIKDGKHIGYFEVELECYDQRGTLLNTYTKTLADYRNGLHEDPVTQWAYWPIGEKNVKTVKFNFKGSDTGDYGLNTPAYLCIDDIVIY